MALNEAVSGPEFYKKIRRFLSRKRTRTYIVPTRFGLSFGAMTLVLFFLAVGYANNLIYIFVFFLISVALTGTLITNRNVEGLELEGISSQGFFAEELGDVIVRIKNHRASVAWNTEYYFQKDNPKSQVATIESQYEEDIVVELFTPQRGVMKLPRLIAQSVFPFGLLRAWKVFKNNPDILVYPARKGMKEFPLESRGAEDKQNTGLFREHRSYQNTDSMMRIDWRASARRQELLVKNFEGTEKQSLYFNWNSTAHIKDLELRLCQLSLWIDEAERQGHSYALEIGKSKTELSAGMKHYTLCLEVLATISTEGLS